jgi:hypothetical protein
VDYSGHQRSLNRYNCKGCQGQSKLWNHRSILAEAPTEPKSGCKFGSICQVHQGLLAAKPFHN